MQIDVEKKDGYTLATLHGALDDLTKEPFDNTLHPIIADGGARLVLDMSDCPRITSSGIASLVVLVTRSNVKSSRVIIASPSPFVQQVITLSKLDKLLDVVESPEAAAEHVMND